MFGAAFVAWPDCYEGPRGGAMNASTSSNETFYYRVVDGVVTPVGRSDCCKCGHPTEDYVLCVECGSVKPTTTHE